MSFARLQNEMRRQALMAAQTSSNGRLALVTSFDPNRYAAKVLLQPQGIETGWLPVKSIWVGNGWGLFCPPSEGDQVLVDFQEGSIEAGIIQGGLFSDVDRPLPAPSGEFWIVHQSGSSLKFTNDTNVTLNAAGALNITVGGNVALNVQGAVNATVTGNLTASAEAFDLTGNMTLNGNLSVEGGITTTGAVTANGGVNAGSISLTNHVHAGVQTGSGTTGAAQG